MNLVILAGGMGSRFGGLKQLTPVDEDGNFILDYSIYDAIKAGFDKVVFIIKEENYEAFRETVGKRIEKKVKTEYAFQKNDNIPDIAISYCSLLPSQMKISISTWSKLNWNHVRSDATVSLSWLPCPNRKRIGRKTIFSVT